MTTNVGALLEQLIMAPQPMRLDAAKRVRDGIATLVAQVAELTRERDEARALVKQFEAEAERRGHMATRNLAGADEEYVRANAAAREVTRLTEALAAAERRATLEADAPALVARVRDLEAQLATKAGYDVWMRTAKDLGAKLDGAESERAALRAEVERLRRAALNEAGHAIASEDRLAAANALLQEAPYALVVRGQDWIRRRDTHLAAQPATAPADVHVPRPELDGRTPREMMLPEHMRKPVTAPAWDEAEQDPAARVLSWAGPAARTDLKEARTEADAVPTAHLEFLRGRGTVLQSNLAAAELARRGRKPNQ